MFKKNPKLRLLVLGFTTFGFWDYIWRQTETCLFCFKIYTNKCADALYIVKSRDHEDAFSYCDPPYFNSDCGHYDGYSQQDFENLLQSLSEIKGKFLLSSYPSPVLQAYAKKHNWHMWSVEQGVSVNSKSGYLKRKVEVLTANYPLV